MDVIISARNANVWSNFLCSENGFYSVSVKPEKIMDAVIYF